MQTRFRFSLIIIVLYLGGCQGWLLGEREIYLPSGDVWSLLSPADSGLQVFTVQKVTAQYGEKEIVMLMQLEIDAESTRLVALNPTLMPLFSLQDDGDVIQTEVSPLAPGKLDPRYVLADIQLVYWPLDTLEVSLRPAGLHLKALMAETQGYQPGIRQLIDEDGTELIRIVYEDSEGRSVHFENKSRHYQYHIETLEWKTP